MCLCELWSDLLAILASFGGAYIAEVARALAQTLSVTASGQRLGEEQPIVLSTGTSTAVKAFNSKSSPLGHAIVCRKFSSECFQIAAAAIECCQSATHHIYQLSTSYDTQGKPSRHHA